MVIIKTSNAISLILLNVKAFIAAFKVLRRKVQKFINKKDVKPISSQPKKSSKTLSAVTSNAILIMNQFKSKINRSVWGSFLK